MKNDVRRRSGGRARLAAAALAVIAMSAAGGCASVEEGEAAAVAADRDATWRERAEAIRVSLAQVRAGEADAAEFREAMKTIAWRRSDPAPVRMAAIDALGELDAADTQAMLTLLLPTETDWSLIVELCEMAAERGWSAVTPGLVRSWSRPVVEPGDDARPERKALAALHPGRAVEEVVFEVFATPLDGPFGERTRSDAWALLRRIDEQGERTRALLVGAPEAPGDAMLSDLRAGARELGAIPETSEQLAWLRLLRTTEHAAFWSEAAAAIAGLGDEQRRGLEIRHAAGARWAAAHRPEWLRATRAELMVAARRAQEGVKMHQRLADAPDAMSALKETVDAWEKELVWGDLVLALIAFEAVRDVGVRAELFKQAEIDRRDPTTEHGGVLDAIDAEGSAEASAGAGGARFEARHFPPRPTQRASDDRFIASPEMIGASAAALFQYHFHVQMHANREYAGPGVGDIAYAKNLGRSCIVFTFVSRDVMNADYYQGDGVRIDLGEIEK